MERPLVLMLDGDTEECARVRGALAEAGCEVLVARTEDEGLRLVGERGVRVLLAASPPWLPLRGGLLERAARLRPSLVTIALLDRNSPGEESGAYAAGAFDVLSGSRNPARIKLAVERALAQHDILEERRSLRDRTRILEAHERIAGASASAAALRERVESLAPTKRWVLFAGETGTGKRLAARVLHDLSPRSASPFVEVDCSTPSAELLEAELFGRDRGGRGGLERAGGGTLLLNDVDGLPPDAQERLADKLSSGERVHEGGGARLHPDLRVLSTTRVDLARQASTGRFREDLFRAIAEETIEIPPLRERPEDVPTLARHFVEEIRAINHLPPVQIAVEALDALARYTWPGNVRELRNAVEQGVILASAGTIRFRDLPESVRSAIEEKGGEDAAAARFREAKRRVVESFEKRYLGELLARHHGNVTAAAQHAGMLRSALQRLLRKYDLRSSDFRGGHGERTLE